MSALLDVFSRWVLLIVGFALGGSAVAISGIVFRGIEPDCGSGQVAIEVSRQSWTCFDASVVLETTLPATQRGASQ